MSVLQDSKILEKLADVGGLGAGDRHVVGGPGVGGDFVFAPAGVAAGLGAHFEKDEIAETALLKAPGGTEAGDATADNDHRDFFDALARRKAGAAAQEVTPRKGIVDERAFDPFVTFEEKTGERRAAKTDKLAAGKFQ